MARLVGPRPFGADPAKLGPEPYIKARLVGSRLFGTDAAELGPEPYIKLFIPDKPFYIWPGIIYKMVYPG